MVEPCIRKCRGNVAHRAVLRCRQVSSVLAGGRYTVMAGCTVVDDTRVIEHGRDKGAAGDVADIAVLGRRHVAR